MVIIYQPGDIKSSEITPKDIYLNRRRFLREMAAVAAAGASAALLPSVTQAGQKIPNVRKSPLSTGEKPTSVAGHHQLQQFLRVRHGQEGPRAQRAEFPHLALDRRDRRRGEEARGYQLEDLLKQFPLEERIYRLRCVEAWSMVMPWVGFPLRDLILPRFEPTSQRQVCRVHHAATIRRRCPARQRVRAASTGPTSKGCGSTRRCTRSPSWPSGCTARSLPNQNGAPLRLVVPWKYGFKSIKSIVKIRFVGKAAADHLDEVRPERVRLLCQRESRRWITRAGARPPSGASARIRCSAKRKTLMFNGYAEQVARLYAGMDLKKFF